MTGPLLEQLQRDLNGTRTPLLSEALVTREAIAFHLAKANTTLVTILGPVPPPRLAYVREGLRWHCFWTNGNPVKDGLGKAIRSLAPSDVELDPGAAAEDLTRMLVDPDGTYGVVIGSLDKIPVDRRNSDRLRDLEKSGATLAEIREALLKPGTFSVSPPVVEQLGGRAVLVFYSWSYFGGIVTRWEVVLDGARLRSPKATVVVTEVGSYNLPM